MSFTAEQLDRRRLLVPEVTYPDLPVSERRDDIADAIRDHQVVVIAGETGSGKTTQLPKICLELGRGIGGLVGHTQPRRIAARSVAERVAEELNRPLGSVVGYQVRFTDRTSDETLVKVMTDGVLLAEIAHDRLLSRYDTLIIDEAHERSLTIDFLLGYVRRLLPRRPDLRVIITSATIDPARFAEHFEGAPVIEVSGRTYPVEVRYRSLLADTVEGVVERDQVQGICDALHELDRAGRGDVLVFLSGEREIRDTAEAVRALHLKDTEVLPLYGRLSSAEQHRVFASHPGRRIVLSTNVAETSLTVPGIRYVVDPGTARISRYSNRTKVQRLPIEAISQASANQRMGRCGRQSDGICIRLYSEEDFLARPPYTEPEILRTSLAAVLLQMAALDLGDVESFPFLDPPDARQVRDGVQLLEELGALDGSGDRQRLTPLGRRLARLPIDPRLGRMVLEAERNGCLPEVLVITAALSIQDPRERPIERAAAAEQSHARFIDRTSDFLTLLSLWEYIQERQDELSSSAFRRMCHAEFLHYLRIREWQDLVAQLRQAARSVGAKTHRDADPKAERTQADADRIHLSLLAGLLSHVGARDGDTRDYAGARGSRFVVWPGSGLARKPPRFIMAAELVETSRLWARVVARVEPERVEALAAHLVKRSYSEPHWEKDRGAVVAYERVTLYGVPLVAHRKVAYGGIDPELSRSLFIRHALVQGEWRTHHTFWHENLDRLADIESLEDRVRRRDVVVDDETLYDLYDARLPADVVSARHFDRWWKQARRSQPDLLTFTEDMLTNALAPEVSEEDYPDTWQQGDLVLPLSYRFEPGASDDGVTVTAPLAALPRLDAEDFLWQVPGFRLEAVTALIRSLPKAVRRAVVPAPDRARSALAALQPRAEPLLPALGRELGALTGAVVAPSDWDVGAVPAHLRVNFRVVDDTGKSVGEGRDLAAIRVQLAPRVRKTVAAAAASVERTGLRDWTVGDIPRTFAGEAAGHAVQGFPALVGQADSVSLRVLATEREQSAQHPLGVRRLLMMTLPSPVASLRSELSAEERLIVARSPYPTVVALLEDCVACAVDSLIRPAPPWRHDDFVALRVEVRSQLPARTRSVLQQVLRVLRAALAVEQGLSGQSSLALLASLADIREQLSRLIPVGFVSATGWDRLRDVERYVRALGVRLERLPERPANDAASMATMRRLEDELAARSSASAEAVDEVRGMLEELRVSLWAQSLGTAFPVSEKRVLRALDALSG